MSRVTKVSLPPAHNVARGGKGGSNRNQKRFQCPITQCSILCKCSWTECWMESVHWLDVSGFNFQRCLLLRAHSVWLVTRNEEWNVSSWHKSFPHLWSWEQTTPTLARPWRRLWSSGLNINPAGCDWIKKFERGSRLSLNNPLPKKNERLYTYTSISSLFSNTWEKRWEFGKTPSAAPELRRNLVCTIAPSLSSLHRAKALHLIIKSIFLLYADFLWLHHTDISRGIKIFCTRPDSKRKRALGETSSTRKKGKKPEPERCARENDGDQDGVALKNDFFLLFPLLLALNILNTCLDGLISVANCQNQSREKERSPFLLQLFKKLIIISFWV